MCFCSRNASLRLARLWHQRDVFAREVPDAPDPSDGAARPVHPVHVFVDYGHRVHVLQGRLEEALGAEATPRGRIQQANTDATAPKVPAQERLVGTLKSFSAETGYGFIRCGAVPGDVFVRQVDLPLDAAPPGPGRSLEFVLCRDQQGRPQAREVSWLQGAQTAPSSTSRRFYGQLKSIGDKYGFIECPEAFGEYGRDVYLARGSLPAGEEWRTLHHLSFEVVPNQRGEPQAKDVVLEAAPAHCPASADSSEPEVTARATRW